MLGAVSSSFGPPRTAIDDRNLYWKTWPDTEQDNNSMCGMQPLSGAPATRWTCFGNGSIAVAGDTYYETRFCVQGLQCGSVYKDMIGGRGQLIASSDSNGIHDLVISDNHLYWNNVLSIIRSNLDGSDQTVIAELHAPTVDSAINAFTVDDAYVYWSTSYQTAIWRSAK